VKHPNNDIGDEACKSFDQFCRAYLGDSSEGPFSDENSLISDLRKLQNPSMNDANIAVTRGYNMAFGVFTKKLLLYFSPDIIDVLAQNCVAKKRESDDAETRKQAVRSLVKAVATLGIENISAAQRMLVLETLYKGFDDYAVDRRGDVGSWVRSESMIALSKYFELIMTCKDENLKKEMGADTPEFFERFISQHLQ
jgi:hypothetical protein